MANLFNDHGSNNTIKWQPEPTTRGTFNLLSTCIITLTLCVWSAVHLNLPGNNRSFWHQFLRRLAWITVSLIAPEWLILTAQSQRQTAKRISKEVEEIFKSEKKATADPESQPICRRHPWTMTHSFWAIMGGIAMDPSGSDPFIPSSQRSTLTAKGISLLLRHEPQLLPDISEEDVKDKSKGSSFTKFAACIQATWFCLSCVARISRRLPISLLEVNTFAHALCTVIVYTLWWRKPLDVEQPLVLHEEGMRPLLAYMWMASKTSCIPKPSNTPSGDTIKVGRDPEFEAIIYEKESSQATTTNADVSNNTQVVSPNIPPVHNLSTRSPNVANSLIIEVTTTAPLPDTGFRANGTSTRWKVSTTHSDGNQTYTSIHYNPAVFNLTPDDVRRWKLAREAMDKYGLTKPSTNLDLVTMKPIEELMDSEGQAGTNWASFWLPFVAACYGGLHALGWNARFPSHRELILWRVSALIIASPAALFVLLILLSSIISCVVPFARRIFKFCGRKPTPTSNLKDKKESPPKTPVVKQTPLPETTAHSNKIGASILEFLKVLASSVAFAALMFLYMPARGYLVVESFRTVFFLPPEAYRATSWTQYLPHIT